MSRIHRALGQLSASMLFAWVATTALTGTLAWLALAPDSPTDHAAMGDGHRLLYSLVIGLTVSAVFAALPRRNRR